MNENTYMSIRNTNALKGLLAVAVVISHIYTSSSFQFSSSLLEFVFGSVFGFVPVSVFFFLSGYGMMCSYRKRGTDYLRHFPRNRILPLYLNMCVMIAVYLVLNLVLNGTFDPMLLLTSLTLGSTVIKYGWYLQTILVLYLLFWICFSVKLKERQKLCLFAVLLVLIYVLLLICGTDPTCYATAPCLLLGMLWSALGDRIDRMINTRLKKWVCIFSLLLLSMAIKVTAPLLPAVVAYAFQLTGTAVCFTLTVILFLKGISLCHPAIAFLGRISLEIYVTQGIAIMLLTYFGLHTVNILLYGTMVMVATLILSVGLHPIFAKIAKAVRNSDSIQK